MGQGLAAIKLWGVAQDQTRAREPPDFGERSDGWPAGPDQLREAARHPHNGETADGHNYP